MTTFAELPDPTNFADNPLGGTTPTHTGLLKQIIDAGVTVEALAAAASSTWPDATGDLLIGTGPNTAARRARGAANRVLGVNTSGTDLDYLDVYAVPQQFDSVQVDSFTFASDQCGQWVVCQADDPAPREIVLPSESVSYPVGGSTVLEFMGDVEWVLRAGSGAIIATQSGVSGNPRPTGDGAIIVVTKRAAGQWRVTGDIVTASLEAAEHGFHPMRISPVIPQLVNGGYGANANSHWNRSYVEEASPGTRRLWTIYIDSARKPRLARRTVLSRGGTVPSAWSELDLSTKMTMTGGGVIDSDSHCYMNVHIDSDGYVHVLGGMHGDPIAGHYCVSRVPYSLTLADYVPALFRTGGTHSTILTYPQMVDCSDGSFVLFHRESSDPGAVDHESNEYFRRYVPNGSAPPASGPNDRWQTEVLFCKGIDDPLGGRSIYKAGIATDPRDRARHYIFFHWRDDVTENVDKLACVVTQDDFATFELVDGTPVTLPIDTSDYVGAMVVDNVPLQSNSAFTAGGACVDWVPQDPTDPNSPGRPQVSYTKTQSGSIVIHHAYWDGTEWVVTSTGPGMATAPNLPSLIATPEGGTYAIFMVNGGGKEGSVRLFDVTPGSAYTYADVEIMNIEFKGNDIGCPQQGILDFGEAHFLLSQVGNLHWADETSDPIPWNGDAFVVSLDAVRLADIAAGRAFPMRSRRLGDVAIPGTGKEVTVSGASVVDLGLSRISAISGAGWPMARFVGFGKVDAGSVMSVHMGQEHPPTGTTANQLACVVDWNTYAKLETPWMPLRTLLFLAQGEVSVWAGITTGTGKGYLRGVLQVQTIPVERF